MKLITRDTDYALRAVCFIAKSEKTIVSVEELVEKLSIPRSFLRKILQVLNRKRILRSYKGSGGGFVLAKPANRVFLIDLIRIFQGPLVLSECFLKKMLCPNIKICPLRKKLDKIEKFVIKELSSITITSLSAHKT
ncbi:MAG: Rrf2 family transcriptional regulator [Candidatus Omnitrophica bacterium]|jgi:Rrf2 family protein|nr:Rrf2 family transcriptional regulator [Candidatus Omnitrophota bacterium]